MEKLPIGEPGIRMQAMPREPTSQDRIITLLLTIDSDRTIALVRHMTLLEAENARVKEELLRVQGTLRSLTDRDHDYAKGAESTPQQSQANQP